MKIAFLLLAIVFSGLLIFMFLFPTPTDYLDIRPRAKNDVTQLSVALSEYKSEYGTYPSGNQISILKALQGENSKQIVFIELSKKQFDKNGYFIDQWGTPYHIDTSVFGAKPKVWSFGKNKKDDRGADHTDDIASWN